MEGTDRRPISPKSLNWKMPNRSQYKSSFIYKHLYRSMARSPGFMDPSHLMMNHDLLQSKHKKRLVLLSCHPVYLFSLPPRLDQSSHSVHIGARRAQHHHYRALRRPPAPWPHATSPGFGICRRNYDFRSGRTTSPARVVEMDYPVSDNHRTLPAGGSRPPWWLTSATRRAASPCTALSTCRTLRGTKRKKTRRRARPGRANGASL